MLLVLFRSFEASHAMYLLGVLGRKKESAMGNFSNYRVQGIHQLQVVLSLSSFCIGVQGEMGKPCAFVILIVALAFIGVQDFLLVKIGGERMFRSKSIASHIVPANRLVDYALAVINGGGDAHLVSAQALFAVLGTPLMRVVPEHIFVVVGQHIQAIRLYAEI